MCQREYWVAKLKASMHSPSLHMPVQPLEVTTFAIWSPSFRRVGPANTNIEATGALRPRDGASARTNLRRPRGLRRGLGHKLRFAAPPIINVITLVAVRLLRHTQSLGVRQCWRVATYTAQTKTATKDNRRQCKTLLQPDRIRICWPIFCPSWRRGPSNGSGLEPNSTG
jgi:hypothetical protein